jgi:hypothetical protein
MGRVRADLGRAFRELLDHVVIYQGLLAEAEDDDDSSVLDGWLDDVMADSANEVVRQPLEVEHLLRRVIDGILKKSKHQRGL